MAALTMPSPRVLRGARIVGGAALIVVVVITVGTGPLLRGLAAVSALPILVALLLTAVGTSAAAWRWRAVAHGLGVPLSWPGAVAAYYRSQFLNAVLPGGVLGDVHRAYRHGRATDELGSAARAVATERIAGQAVQLVIVVSVLGVLGMTSPLRPVGWVVAGLGAVIVVGLAVATAIPGGRRRLRRELGLLHQVLARPGRAVAIIVSSAVMVAALTTTFVVACLAAGVHAAPRDLIALALITLAASAVPFNLGGWGPREAAAASAFALVGLGAGAGLAASTTFGVLSLISVAPGALVLVADRLAAARAPHPPTPVQPSDAAAVARIPEETIA